MAPSIDVLIPVRQSRLTGGTFSLPKTVTLTSQTPQDMLALGKTGQTLQAAGLKALCQVDAPDAQVRVVRNGAIEHPEGYRLTIAADGVTLIAGTDAGAYYGLATLRALVRAHGAELPCMRIDDEPAFARRGVYHDLARGKVATLETLKGLVERLADWKINELQLYIENAFAFTKHAAIAEGWSPITPAEITELQAHCKAHHVRLVPSLASFGHLEKVLRLPAYASLGELPNGSTLCPTDPRSIKFLDELYGEFLPLFDDPDFNVCCDETWDLGKGRSKQLASEKGVGRVYLEFMLEIHKLCQKYGRRMNAWADIVLEHPELLSDWPKDIVMLNWDYHPQGARIPRTHEVSDAGLPLVVCPGTGAWNSIGSRWPMASENIRLMALQGRDHGAEGLLNTDWGDGGHRQFLAVSLMAFAFGAAESWNPGAADIETYPRLFAFHHFGDTTGELGDAIEALGRSYLMHDQRHGNADPMYHNMHQPLVPGMGEMYSPGRRTLDNYTPDELQRVLDNLPEPTVWQAKVEDDFDRLALAEYALSCAIVATYCERSAVAWDLGLAQPVTAARLTELADDIEAVTDEFRRLWLARNKPSRLADNERIFRSRVDEARELAKARKGR